jgi:uncharacterized protein YcfJ
MGYLGRKAGDAGGKAEGKEHVRYAKMEKYPDLFETAWKRASADKDPREVGKERAHASIAAEFEKDKHHKNEATGDVVGRLGGGLLGAALGGKGLSAVGGAAVGQHLGGHVGRHLGAKKDREAWDKAASAMKLALEGAGLQPKPVEPALDPGTQAYLANEQMAQQAEEAGQVEYLRGKLQEAQQAAAAAGDQNMQLQQQVEQHGAQLQQLQQQASDALNQASMAQDQVLSQQQAATAMRMAYQQLRGQLLEVAAQDPPGVSGMQAAQDAAQAANPQQGADPAAGAGPAGQAPGAQEAPGTAAPGAVGAADDAQGASQAGTPPSPGANPTAQATEQQGQKPEPESPVGKTAAAVALLSAWRSGQAKEAALRARPFARALP